jgi:recombinational DNA repair protein RecR
MTPDVEARYHYLAGRLDDKKMTNMEAEELSQLTKQVANDLHEEPSISMRAALLRAAVVWRFHLPQD